NGKLRNSSTQGFARIRTNAHAKAANYAITGASRSVGLFVSAASRQARSRAGASIDRLLRDASRDEPRAPQCPTSPRQAVEASHVALPPALAPVGRRHTHADV